jgi:hypothetical protein
LIIFFLHVLLLNFNSFLYIPHSVDFFHFWYLLYFQGPSLPFSIASCYGFLFSSFSWHTVSLRFSLQCLVSPRSPTPATCKEPKTPGTARSEAERSAPPRASSRRSALLPRPPCFRPRPAGQAEGRGLSCPAHRASGPAPPVRRQRVPASSAPPRLRPRPADPAGGAYSSRGPPARMSPPSFRRRPGLSASGPGGAGGLTLLLRLLALPLAAGTDCPCSEPALCRPIRHRPDFEVSAFPCPLVVGAGREV